jgi:hypothetical protein
LRLNEKDTLFEEYKFSSYAGTSQILKNEIWESISFLRCILNTA